MTSTSFSGWWFILTAVFVLAGMLVDGLKTIIFCMVFCSSFMLCCQCVEGLSDRRTRRSRGRNCGRGGAIVDDVNSEISVDVDVIDLLLLETPVFFDLLSFSFLRREVFYRGEEEATVCTVCQRAIEYGELVVALPLCAHVFHVECVKPWLEEHSTCPNCRAYVSETAATSKRRRNSGAEHE